MKSFSIFCVSALAGSCLGAAIPLRVIDGMVEVERGEPIPQKGAFLEERQVLGTPTRTIIEFPP